MYECIYQHAASSAFQIKLFSDRKQKICTEKKPFHDISGTRKAGRWTLNCFEFQLFHDIFFKESE